MGASKGGHLEVAKYLVSKGADVKTKNDVRYDISYLLLCFNL